MGILLLILKIIGIFLIVLLLFVIAVIVVPVRYKINIRGQDEIEGKAVFYWMFHFLDMRICYLEKKVSYKLRILGISFLGDKKKKKRKRRKTARKKTERKFKEEQTEKEFPEEKRTIIEEQAEIREDTAAEEARRKMTEPEKDIGEERTWRAKESSRFDSLKDRSAAFKEKYLFIKNLLLDETNKNALFMVMRELKYLLRHFSPRKVSGNIEFAMGDPAQTGKVLGAVSIFPFWARYKVNIMPDFMAEDFYLKGNVYLKGHIRGLHLLITFIRLIKNQDIKSLIGQMRK